MLYLGGFGIIALIWIITGITAKDPLWGGKAIIWSSIVLLGVALAGIVIRRGMEKP